MERRILNEYSDSEREAEYAALESQRRQLRACLRTEAESPPSLKQKHMIPLPLTTPPFLSLNSPPGDEGARINSDAVADSKPSTVDNTRFPCFASESRINEATALPIEQTRQRSPLSLRPSLRRPSLRIVIPGSNHHLPWLDGPLFCSPLVCISDMPTLLRPPLTPRSVREWCSCTFSICSSQCASCSGTS
jgi:hypothetical protein